MKKIILGALMVTSITVVNAQMNENLGFQIKAANVQFGFTSGRSAISNLSDFQKLAPNSDFKESDVLGFKAQNNFFGPSGVTFNANLVFAKPTEENTSRLNTEFRLGISFQQSDVFSLGYSRTDEFRVDTLTSARNGDQTFIDSSYTQDYSLFYTQRHVMVDADVTVSTDPNKRWKFYGGIGLSLGLSVAPYTSISYNTRSALEQSENRFNTFDNESDSETTVEKFRNDGGFFGRLYVPLGIDFRIGKRKESLKKYHLFVESRTSLTVQSVPELNLITNTATATGFGVRYDF
jgi:hypothetical protein